jgi:hypothetical protein
MSYALLTPNMYMYNMWTVVWRLTPVLDCLQSANFVLSTKKRPRFFVIDPSVWFCPQLNAGLELFSHGHCHLATLYMGEGADEFARAF